MGLPDQTELLKLFSAFLIEAGLSAVSIKNYLSDLRHFLSFCATETTSVNPVEQPTVKDIFQNIDKYLDRYIQSQKSTFTPPSTTNRRLASIRRFSTFLKAKFSISNIFTDQNISENIKKNENISSDQTTSSSLNGIRFSEHLQSVSDSRLSSTKLLEQFKASLEKEKKTHSTIKNYLSDLNHFFLWTAKQTPFTDQNLVNILSDQLLKAYITYLKLSHTSTSVINRRQSSIKKLTKFSFDQGYLPENPFEIKAPPKSLAPLAWIERLSEKRKKNLGPKNRLTKVYERYSALPWTPYLNLALLVLATTAMAIFAYNQIISAARPSSAATALTPPRRQLSFQGRLTDSSGTPITTAVSVVFRLFNQLTPPGTQLYTSNTCSITPDQDGIFNTLIGDGVCGAEIASSVFTDNRDVFLEIQVGSETLTPRQQIATVGFALNSETLQGYPASASATINTVPVIDNTGNINIAVTSPSIISTDGTFTIEGQALALTTTENSGGDIILQPDALGSGQILALGGTTDEDSFRVTNANLTTGSLISGYVGNDLLLGRLISLTSGSTETDRFWVATDGRTSINASATDSALIINQTGTGNLISASVSGSPVFTVTQDGNVDITGQYLVDGAPVSSSNWQRTDGSLAPLNITDSVNIGAVATASALVHLAGTSGENSFVNTGNLGIGTTTPDNKVELLGTGRQLRLTYTDASLYSEIYTGSDGALYLDPSHASNAIYLAGNSAFLSSSTTSQWNHTNGTILLQNSTMNGASGTATPVKVVPFLTPSTGTMNMDAFTIQPTINQSGTATGNYTALKVNVTQTSVLGSTNYLAQLGVGGVYSFNIENSGQVGIGLTNPAYSLDVSGDINITGQYLVNGTPLTASNWQRTDGSLAPLVITDSVNIGATATDSAYVHLAGTSGENSFVNTGNFGIGVTSPTAKLDVNTGGQFAVNTLAGAMHLRASGTPATDAYGAGIIFSEVSGLSGVNNGAAIASYQSGADTNSTGLKFLYHTVSFGASRVVGMILDGAGNLSIGTANPAYKLDVAGDINLTGALRDNGDAGTSGQLLSSTATGIDWIDVSSVNYWQRNSGVLTPLNITDALTLGDTATASAYVHFAGTAGDDSFINNGNFGIGLTNPAYTLDVAGDINLTGALRDNGGAGTAGQILSSTGTGVEWIDNTATSSGSGDSLWTTSNGAIYPINATWDAFIGGDSTASAKFGFINVDSGTPTASISGTTTDVATYLTGEGNLATTNMAPLTIGGTTTGPIQLSPKGTNGLRVDAAGRVGIGATTPGYGLYVTGSGDSGAIATTVYVATPAIRGSLYSGLTRIAMSTADTIFYGYNGATNEAFRFDGAGNLAIGRPTASSKIDLLGNFNEVGSATISASYAGGKPLVVKGFSGQTANLQEWQNSTGTPLTVVDSNGNIGIGDSTPLSALTVGDGDDFQVNSTGAIVAATGITSSGTITFSAFGTGIVHSDSSGVLSSSAIDLASSDVTGILPIARGGTNNDTYATDKFLVFDGTKIAASAFDSTSFEAPLTFSNGLTRTLNNIVWGGQLTGATNIDMNGNDVTFTGSGNFGIGVASPSAKFDVAGVFVVDSTTGRVGIGTTTPSVSLDIAGTTSTISNSAGDITINAASGVINFSGDSLDNILNATISGQLKLGNYPTVGLPDTIGTGSLVYDSTTNNPLYWDGTAWKGMGSYLSRTSSGILYPTSFYDSINVGGTPSASSSALVRLSSSDSFYSFFYNPTAFGFNDTAISGANTILEAEGDISPHSDATWNLGSASFQWQNLNLANGIFVGGTEVVATNTNRLTGSTPWAALTGLRVGDGGSPVGGNALPTGIQLYVNGGATVSGTFGVVGNSSLIGDVTVGGGTGKIDVGTVDPPYTINGEKYGTYMAGMIGVKEEVMGRVNTSEYVNGLGYRTLIDLDGQVKGSDLWLFSKTTNLINNLNQLAVLLTASGQAKTWYEIDEQNNILAIYSSTPSNVIYRLTAPRFDADSWTNTRTSDSIGFVINNPDVNQNITGTGLLADTVNPELIDQVDKTYTLKINGKENKEVSSFFSSIIANLQVGTQVVASLLVDNLTVRTKLISPIADIDSLKVVTATVSGVLYADNIKGKTIDNLTAQLNLLDEKYSTASAILTDLQAKYTSYDSLLGKVSTASVSGDPLALSPLATTSAILPSDLALNSLSVHTIYSNDIMANGSIFTQAINSIESDLFIQPTGDKPVHLLANLMTLYPDGKVVVSGDLLITGTIYSMGLDTHTATVSGSLALGKGDLATDSGKLIALFDDKGQIVGSIDASGSANFGQLVTGGLIIASGINDLSSTMSAQTTSNTTIGTATIATGSAEIQVVSNKVTDHTLIYITPISDTSNQVKDQISFNYWLVETK